MTCPNCKTQISNGTTFCPNCGRCVDAQGNMKNQTGVQDENAALKKAAEAAQAENIKLKKQIKTIVIVAIVLDLAAVAFVVVKNMMSDKDRKEAGKDGAISIESASVGDYIEFGAYEQDNNTSNGKEPIEWRVLEVEGNRALLISEKALDCVEYNKEWKTITWEDCTLREWLNNEFINEAFSSSEKSQIPTVKVEAEDNSEFGTEAGNDTEDKVFLLSIDEAEMYFDSDDERICKPTEYAVANNADVEEDYGSCWWWLRSPGFSQDSAAYVTTNGYVIESGLYVYNYYVAVRPALWVNLES